MIELSIKNTSKDEIRKGARKVGFLDVDKRMNFLSYTIFKQGILFFSMTFLKWQTKFKSNLNNIKKFAFTYIYFNLTLSTSHLSFQTIQTNIIYLLNINVENCTQNFFHSLLTFTTRPTL